MKEKNDKKVASPGKGDAEEPSNEPSITDEIWRFFDFEQTTAPR